MLAQGLTHFQARRPSCSHCYSLCKATMTRRPGLVGPDTAQEQQTQACTHIWISHICTARGHNQLTATSVASLSKQLAHIKESIPRKDDAIPGQAREKASLVINRQYLSGCHKIRAHRCTHRLIVDKSSKNATTPISSLCRIPVWRAYPVLPDLEEIWPAPPRPRTPTRRGANGRCSLLASLQLHL